LVGIDSKAGKRQGFILMTQAAGAGRMAENSRSIGGMNISAEIKPSLVESAGRASVTALAHQPVPPINEKDVIMKQGSVKALKCLGIVAVVLALGYAILAVSASRSLNRVRAALEADGRPIEFADIIPAEVPESDNAALVYRRVVLQLKATKAENGEKSLWDALKETLAESHNQINPDAPDPELAERFVQLFRQPAVTEALADLEAGSRKSGYWNDLDFRKGISLALPHLRELSPLTEILCVNARIQSGLGDPAAAWSSILAALRVADALSHEPLLYNQRVRATQFGIVVDTIQDLPYSSATQAELVALLAAGESPTSWAAGFDSERIFAGEALFGGARSERREKISMFGGLVDGEAKRSRSELSLYLLIGPLARFDRAAHMSVTDEMARMMLKPYSVEDSETIQQLQDDLPWYCVVTRIMASAVGSYRTVQTELLAQVRVTRAGLAVLQHREEQGAWPEALPASADLVDPFTGEALIYQPNPKGFVLYSVGANLVDDTGIPGEEGRRDIVWLYSAE
jgi:hypothetical protein